MLPLINGKIEGSVYSEQKLPTNPEHLSSPPFLSGVRVVSFMYVL
jgi:hypothetical protein